MIKCQRRVADIEYCESDLIHCRNSRNIILSKLFIVNSIIDIAPFSRNSLINSKKIDWALEWLKSFGGRYNS